MGILGLVKSKGTEARFIDREPKPVEVEDKRCAGDIEREAEKWKRMSSDSGQNITTVGLGVSRQYWKSEGKVYFERNPSLVWSIGERYPLQVKASWPGLDALTT